MPAGFFIQTGANKFNVSFKTSEKLWKIQGNLPIEGILNSGDV